MNSKATNTTPATTARKATTRVATRAGRDTGYHLVPAQRAMRMRPAAAKLAGPPPEAPGGGRVGLPPSHASARGGGLPVYAPIVTVSPAHLQHLDPWMTKLSSGPGRPPRQVLRWQAAA